MNTFICSSFSCIRVVVQDLYWEKSSDKVSPALHRYADVGLGRDVILGHPFPCSYPTIRHEMVISVITTSTVTRAGAEIDRTDHHIRPQSEPRETNSRPDRVAKFRVPEVTSVRRKATSAGFRSLCRGLTLSGISLLGSQDSSATLRRWSSMRDDMTLCITRWNLVVRVEHGSVL